MEDEFEAHMSRENHVSIFGTMFLANITCVIRFVGFHDGSLNLLVVEVTSSKYVMVFTQFIWASYLIRVSEVLVNGIQGEANVSATNKSLKSERVSGIHW